MADLFGDTGPGVGQLSMFGDGDQRMANPTAPDITPDPERVRAKLLALLDTARKAQSMPWPERKARMWQIVFPQMANWLPSDEADQLRFDFAQEIERLRRAA